MDIPAAVDVLPPPPSYNEIDPLAPYEYGDTPATPPPLYTEATAQPTYKKTGTFPNRAQTSPLPNGVEANPFSVLNVPRVEMVSHREQVIVHQMVRNEAPQVIVVQPQQIAVAFGDTPTATVCRYCQKSILTVVDYKPGCAAWAMCLLLTCLGLVCGFCLIPFCVRGFQDAHHSCPNCHNHLGIYTRK